MPLSRLALHLLPPSRKSQCPLSLCLVAALLLPGCGATTQPAAWPTPPATTLSSTPAADTGPSSATTPRPQADATAPVAPLLAQTDRLLRLPPAELAKEITRLGETEDIAADSALLLATALAQTRQPMDTARALGLVQRVLGNNTPAALPLHPLARLLEARLLQQRRLEDQLDRQAQQLRDSQRRNDQLNERLEAVRAIERSLTTRPAAPPAAPATTNANGAQRPGP